MSLEILSFPGVAQPTGLHAMRTNGIHPNQMILWCLPQTGNIASMGTLLFGNEGTVIEMRDCLVDRPNYRASTNGHTIGLVLLDRRWRWKHATVTGRYNVPRADGTFLNQKSAQDLATLCFQAMGESSSIVGDIPGDAYPEVAWDATRADIALDELCEMFGCEPTLFLSDAAGVIRYGFGNSPPNNLDIQSLGITIDPPTIPKTLRAICNKTVVQCRMEYEAVGIDRDGSIVPIDDLTYKPTGGWETEADWTEFPAVAEFSDRLLAAQSVGKMYRPVSFADGTMEVPGLGVEIDYIDRLTPFHARLLETFTVEDDVVFNVPKAIGKYWVEGSPSVSQNTADYEPVNQPFRFDRGSGIVKFEKPLLKMSSTNQWEPADLLVSVAFSVERPDSLLPIRAEFTRDIGGTIGEVVLETKIRPHMIVCRYDDTVDATAISELADNWSEIETEAGVALQRVAETYVTQIAGQIVYRNIHPIYTDGVVRQVYWSIGESGFTTVASVNAEGIPNVPRLADRRNWRRTRGAIGFNQYTTEQYRQLKSGSVTP